MNNICGVICTRTHSKSGGGESQSVRSPSLRTNEFIEKYKAYRESNEFEIEHFQSMDLRTQWAFYSIVWIKDPLYRVLMNWWVTGFADRFLFYEEFVCGAVEGLEYLVQCLEDREYEPLKECLVKEVYDHVEQLRDSLLKEKGYSMEKAMAHIFNVRVDREKVDLNQLLQRQQESGGQSAGGHLYNVPVEMAFDVKYFCKFHNEESGENLYKIIDILWHSKFDPVVGERLKYEISSPWTIHHITVSVVEHTE